MSRAGIVVSHGCMTFQKLGNLSLSSGTLPFDASFDGSMARESRRSGRVSSTGVSDRFYRIEMVYFTSVLRTDLIV